MSRGSSDPYRWSRRRYPYLVGALFWLPWGYVTGKLSARLTEPLSGVDAGLIVILSGAILVIVTILMIAIFLIFRRHQKSIKSTEIDESGSPRFRIDIAVHGYQLALSAIPLVGFLAIVLVYAAFSLPNAVGFLVVIAPFLYMSIYRIVILLKCQMKIPVVIDSEGITLGDPQRDPWNVFLWQDIEAILFSAPKTAQYFRIKIRDGATRPPTDWFSRIQIFLLWLSGYPPHTLPLNFFDVTQEEFVDYMRRVAPSSVHIS